MPCLSQVVEELHELRLREADLVGELKRFPLVVEVRDALDLPRVTTAVVLDVHAGGAGVLKLTGDLRQLLTNVRELLTIVLFE